MVKMLMMVWVLRSLEIVQEYDYMSVPFSIRHVFLSHFMAIKMGDEPGYDNVLY